ncbi:MAG: DUF1840 domain-containing protein [Comamonas sp.]
MLYRFKSTATADLTMLEAAAERVLQAIGKSPGAQGVISPDEVPGAVQALRQAVAAEQARQAQSGGEADDGDAAAPGASAPAVTLGQRAAPFIQMLETAAAAGARVTWGV